MITTFNAAQPRFSARFCVEEENPKRFQEMYQQIQAIAKSQNIEIDAEPTNPAKPVFYEFYTGDNVKDERYGAHCQKLEEHYQKERTLQREMAYEAQQLYISKSLAVDAHYFENPVYAGWSRSSKLRAAAEDLIDVQRQVNRAISQKYENQLYALKSGKPVWTSSDSGVPKAMTDVLTALQKGRFDLTTGKILTAFEAFKKRWLG